MPAKPCCCNCGTHQPPLILGGHGIARRLRCRRCHRRIEASMQRATEALNTYNRQRKERVADQPQT